MSAIAEYIFAKQALAELDPCPFGNSQMMPVEMVTDDHAYGYWGRPSKPAIAHLIGGVLLLSAVSKATFAEPCTYGGHLIGASSRLSDSQQCSRRAQRAQDIRSLNMQTQVPLARVYDFEKPFPEERSYNPRTPETPRILKLRK